MSISNNEFPQDSDESDSEINLDMIETHLPKFSPMVKLNLKSEEVTEDESRNSEISRAFREDENRPKSPSTPENSNRIMDAMRGISVGLFRIGVINQVLEANWIDQLRNLRQQQQQLLSSSTTIGTGTGES
ncbi:hypothetical protein MKW92_048270 [Papaver armeniacum]|nr:hypothetical protein MKW92_048270 [Papaver armeniacum]